MSIVKDPLTLLTSEAGDLAVLRAKSSYGIEILKIIRGNNLTQKQAAAIAKISQPRISKIVNGVFSQMACDYLIAALARLQDEFKDKDGAKND